jgi:hypothetical protein
MSATEDSPQASQYGLGVSRPPLRVANLPTPEEVFGVPRLGIRETFRYAVGPASSP